MSPFFHSFLIAQIFGLFMFIMSVILLSRVKFYRDLINGMKAHSVGAVVGASVGLLLGIFLVVLHNVWLFQSLVIITIVGWFIFIKSVLWLAFPEAVIAWNKKVYSGVGYYFVAAILMIFGILLLSHGFYHTINS